MTELLFRDDATLDWCEATVVEVTSAGVVLDRTVFYPAGGGQPGDTGTLDLARVHDTVKGEDGAVLHLCEGELPGVGETVTATLDRDRRFAHMRMHTALHLLSVAIPLPVSGGAVGAEKSRLDFDMPDAPEDRDAIERAVNAMIAADHPVTEEWITDADLAANPDLVKTMSVQPPKGAGRVRLVRIGDVDLQPCGGTHVASTGQIGPVRLGKIEKKGKQNRRVYLHFA